MSEYLRRALGELGDDPEGERPPRVAPGKRTLTLGLPARHAPDRDPDVYASPLVQRTASASASASTDDPFALHLGDRPQSKFGDASPLPFRSEMEAGFGTSLDDVTAYKGPQARAAASTAGTEAFALDRQIIFGNANPSKRVVAHEVAHTLQQRNGGVAAHAMQGFGSSPSDPLEREAEHAAAIVVGGGRATIAGAAGAGEAQGFSLGDELKKAVNDVVKDQTGYDTVANTYDTDLDTLTDALGVVGWKFDVKALAAVGKIHLHIDFNTGTVTISGAGLTMTGYDSESFKCGASQIGRFSISAVWDGKKDTVKAAAFQAASLQIAHIVYKDKNAVPPLELTIDRVTTGAVNAGGMSLGSKLDWLVGMQIPQAEVTGIHYPGQSVTANATLTKTNFALKEIGGVLSNSGSTGATLSAAPDFELPTGTVIDVKLDEGSAAVDQAGTTVGTSTTIVTDRKLGASFKHFEAVAKKDGGELGRVEIDDFQLGDTAKGTGAQIGRVLFRGKPDVVEAILAYPAVKTRVAEALAMLRGAGIDPKASVNVELKGIAVGKTKEGFLDKDKEVLGGSIKNLDASIHVQNIGNRGGEGDLSVKMVGFEGVAQGKAINAKLESFSASLTVKGAGTVSLTLNGKNHTKIDLDALGDVGQVQASCDFTLVGDVAPLVDLLGQEAPKLPPEVTKLLPTLRRLGVKGVTATGSVNANADKEGDWKFGVGSDLALEVPAGDKIKLNLGLKAFQVDKDGKLWGAGFRSMLAKLFVSDKEVASLQVDGCNGWLESDAGMSMRLDKVQFNASGNGLAQLAAALNKGDGLPKQAKAIVQAVANHTIANSKAIGTVNDASFKQDAAGKESLDAKSFGAQVWVQNVGGVVVTLHGFHQQDDGKGKQQIAFDRLTADLNTTTKPKAAQLEIKGEKAEITGGGFKFTAKKVHAEGDGALLAQLIKGVQSHINNLPKEIQDSLALVDEFMVNGKGSVDLNDVNVKDGAKGTQATTDFTTDLAIQGVGKVHVEITKMDADISKESTTVKFEKFTGTLKGPKEDNLATVTIVRPADGTSAAKVDATGEQANRDKLFDAIKAHVGALPKQVSTVIDLLKKGSDATVVGDNVEVKKAGDNVEARGNLSGDVNIAKIGHVKFKLVGAKKAGSGAETDDLGGFESLYITVKENEAVAATLDVKGGRVKKDNSFHLDSFNITGDAHVIDELVTEEVQALVHPDVKMWLQRLKQSKLTMGKGTNVDVKTTDQGVSSTLEALDVEGKVSFLTDTGKIIVVPKAHLNLKTVRLAYDKEKGSTLLGTASAHVDGQFIYQDLGSGLEAQGDVDVNTGAINGTLDSSGTHVTAKDVKGTGKVTKTDGPKAASPTTPEPPKGDQKMLDNETKDAANEGVPLVKTIHLHTSTPVVEGNYSGLHIHPGTRLEIDIMATGNKLDSAIVWFVPKPNVYGVVDFDGAGISPRGEVGELKVATGNLFTEWVANQFLPGQVKKFIGDSNKIPLPLTELTKLVTTKLAGMPKTKSNEPSMADVANAILWQQTGGSAILELEATSDTAIKGATVKAGSAIYLRGEATNGESAKLTASAQKVAVKMDGLSAEASGVSMNAAGTRSMATLNLTKLNIQELNVNMPAAAAKPAAAPVQKHAAGAQRVADEHVPQIAAAGVAGSGLALPQLESIQRSFGRHDVSHVQTHVGGAAGDAARAIGAEAYATGDRVAFASQPDLFTAAHEAAHVVQQQGGVQLSGGVGQSGDTYERHADAVADAVVAGRSAEPLLDQMAGGGGSPAVQRTEAADAPVAWSPFPAQPGIGLSPGGGSIQMVTDDSRVTDWLKANQHEVKLSTMTEVIRRVRIELAPQSKSLAVASHQQILDWLKNASSATGVPLPAGGLPINFSPEEIQAAAKSGFSLAASITANVNNGRFNVVAFGKTPDVPKDGVQVAVDTSGASLSSESHGSKVTVQATTDMGVKFSTNIGPVSFSAGIDPNQWQVGISFGPEVTQLSSLAGIMSNAQSAVATGARNLVAGTVTKPQALYDSIKPHLPAIKSAMSAAQSVAAVKPGQVSVGVKATGPGYAPYAAEGAVTGITVMATLSVTF